MSLSVLVGGIPVIFAAYYFFYVPLGTAFLWYGLAVYLTLAVSWSFLDWSTRRAAIRGNNYFVAFVFCLLVVVLIVQKEHEPFPQWGVALVVVAGVAGYSVAGICGIRNFLRWRRGEFRGEQS